MSTERLWIRRGSSHHIINRGPGHSTLMKTLLFCQDNQHQLFVMISTGACKATLSYTSSEALG